MKNLKHLAGILFLLALITGLGACKDRISNLTPNEDSEKFSIESSLIGEEEEWFSIKANYPVIKGFSEKDSLNSNIENLVQNSITRIKDVAAELKEDQNDYNPGAYLNTDFGYFQNENIVSLWMIFDNYYGGAHGIYTIESFTFNIEPGKVYSFAELFHDEGGVNYVLDIILDEVYGDSVEDTYYFEDAVETILAYDEDFNYLIDGDMLNVYFPLYDIAPYAAGIMNFEFSCYELEPYLKLEIFSAMDEQVPTEELF